MTKEKKKQITYVEFSNTNGVQVNYPAGNRIRYVTKGTTTAVGYNSMTSSFEQNKIKEIQMNTVGLVFIMEEGRERHYPYNQIANFTVEEL